ncbi:MAG: ubiquinone/menaquinone biosynthesis methyltransferase [Gammaproteobacteria bacterium]|nr:ubiquinone/menaquinone biosynthesis methyltransferase [Gammaproteobacteria bacterium]MDE0248073.1 ubiquinone/menaquinone biosynthesis methyltransferase [Gammaproteobacteria bacterium]
MTSAPDRDPGSSRNVRTIFTEIAPHYDLLNHLLSANVDRRWRRLAVDALGEFAVGSRKVLDACAGTFDMSLELVGRPGFSGCVTAVDFAFPMLASGRPKLDGRAVLPVCGDCLRLPFPDGSFDAAMVAFGIRNLTDVGAGFREYRRVLRPAGRLAILEFTTPPNRVVRAGYLFYFHRILPLIGRLVSGHPCAYSYLPASVKAFPGPGGIARQLEEAGFANVGWSYLTGGIAALHLGDRPE